MQTALTIFFVLAAIFSIIVIWQSVARAMRHRAAIRRRLAEISRPSVTVRSNEFLHDNLHRAFFGTNPGRDDEPRFVGKHPALGAPYGADNYHPDWGGTKEVTSAASLYQRVRSARMNEIIHASDSMEFDDLVQAAIRLGSTEEIARAYAAEIRISEDGGEELPPAMANAPNVGGIGQPQYRGGNYVEAEEIAEEMQGIQHFGTEPANDPLMALLTTGRVPVTGYRNPIKALAAGVKACGAKIDTASFDRLAELRGDSRPEEIADGFIIRGYDDLQRLCELGNVVIATDPKSGLVVCHDPAEWQNSQA